MAIEGPLKELGIHDVFQLLDLSRKTGVLRVVSDLRNNEGRVWFDDGAVLFAELRANKHRLGDVLLRTGKVSAPDMERARVMQLNGDDRRIGELLVEIGAISQKELDQQVRFQSEEVIFEMMSWQEGHFSFEEGFPGQVPGDGSLRIRTESLLMEGARRIDEWGRMKRVIPHVGVVPVFAESGSGEENDLDLLPTEWEILAAIDGETSIREMSSTLARSDFDVAKIIFGLATAGVLKVSSPRRSQPRVSMGDTASLVDQIDTALQARDLEMARSFAESALEVHSDSAELHLGMARVLRAQSQFEGAEEFCRRALRLDSMLSPAHRLIGDLAAHRGRLGE
ncbi:MAG: DUF4388 domain-containing protein, partial [Gemmatimonadota bacterium]|nr:DUF4388 domain-containing protein [Gemmatimonadota bacterium]